jgi:hypothetical protein
MTWWSRSTSRGFRTVVRTLATCRRSSLRRITITPSLRGSNIPPVTQSSQLAHKKLIRRRPAYPAVAPMKFHFTPLPAGVLVLSCGSNHGTGEGGRGAAIKAGRRGTSPPRKRLKVTPCLLPSRGPGLQVGALRLRAVFGACPAAAGSRSPASRRNRKPRALSVCSRNH